MTALVPLDHSEMVPSRVTKTNFVPTATVPVGLPVPVPVAVGIVTTSGSTKPVPPYSVETPVALSETHQYDDDDRERPQGFFKCESVTGAIVERSEMRLVCV